MTLSDLSIRRPVFAWMMMVALMLFGAIGFTRLGVSQLPDVTFPIITINVAWPGAAPEVVEQEIVNPIEEAVIGVQGLKGISSDMRQGIARIKLEFAFDRDIDAALQETNARVRSVQLPSGADPATLFKINQDDNPIMWLAVLSKRPFPELIEYVDLHIRDKFQVIPGVGNLIVGGYVDRNLRVWVDNAKLTKYDLTILDVEAALLKENTEVTGGYLENDRQELNVRTMGEGVTAEQVANIPITQRGGKRIYQSTVKVGDIARVEDSLADRRRLARSNGVGTVGLGIQKQRGANEIEVADNIKRVIDETNKTLPPDMEIKINYDGTRFTRDSIRATMTTLIESILVTSLVCWLFLGSFRSTFNVLISIPTSILGTFIVIYFLGFTLNFFTLLGLSLAVGIVVDDAIMVLENISRHFHQGKSAKQASIEGAREITFAASAATAAILAVFVSVLFIPGIIGKFLFQFGVTICTAVALSLLEAITLTPMRCSQFMTAKEDESKLAKRVNRLFEAAARRYQSVLHWCLDHPWRTMADSVVFLIIVAVFAWARPPRFELSPPQDISIVLLRFQTPVGSSLQYTSNRIGEVEKWITANPQWIDHYFVNAGGFEGGEINQGLAFVSLRPPNKRDKNMQQIMQIMRKELGKIPDLTTKVLDPSQAGFSSKRGTQIELSLQGADYSVLRDLSQQLMKKFGETGLMTDIDTDFREGAPEVHVVPDREKAAQSQVSMQDITRTIYAAIGGVRAGKFTNGERRYDVRMRLEPAQWRQPEDVEKLSVRTNYGELIPLSQVTHTELTSTLLTIHRENRERGITLYANVTPGKSQGVAVATAQRIGRELLPHGYTLNLAGSSKTGQESGQGIALAFLLGLLTVYMVLGVQFNSFVHPFTVLMPLLPFTLAGALLALLLTNQSVNLYSAIGVIVLLGIVTKNSILLVEFFNQKREHDGLPLREAILVAAPIRLRPIVMTTSATIAAAIPPAIGLAPGAEVRIPLAIAVIGGVTVCTFFTLFVVPCVYELMASFEKGAIFRRFRKPKTETVPDALPAA
jgi:HAE1 family hydrophobic/amphiphilic exporter-1